MVTLNRYLKVCHWRRSGNFNVNSGQISYIVLVFQLLILGSASKISWKIFGWFFCLIENYGECWAWLDILTKIHRKTFHWNNFIKNHKTWDLVAALMLNSVVEPTDWHKMIKHTQTIRWQQPTNCLSVFDHFVGLALKGLNIVNIMNITVS